MTEEWNTVNTYTVTGINTNNTKNNSQQWQKNYFIHSNAVTIFVLYPFTFYLLLKGSSIILLEYL